MRVSTAQIQSQSINAMLDRFSDLAKTQLQLSTGRRILQPSDDPIGAIQVLPLKEIVARHEQYGENSDVAEGRLILEDSTLGEITNLLIRVSELVIQGNNGALNAADRTAIGQVLRQNLASLMSLANTRDGTGEYIFAGDNVDTAPILENPPGTFSYTGDTGQRNLQIGATRQLPVGDSGDVIFMNIAFSGGGTQSLFETIDTLIADMEANTPNTTVLDDIQSAMDNVLSIRSRVGARLNAIDSHRVINDELILRSQQTIANIEDLDMIEAISRLNLELVGLQASQQVFVRIQNLSLFNYL